VLQAFIFLFFFLFLFSFSQHFLFHNIPAFQFFPIFHSEVLC